VRSSPRFVARRGIGPRGYRSAIEATAAQPAIVRTEPQAFLARVFGWMFAGLAVTGIVAGLIGSNDQLLTDITENPVILIVVIVAQLGLVIAISAGINRMPYQLAVFLFALYAAMNGFTLSIILEIYTTGSIASAFVVSAGMFGAMATYGYVTGRDLSNLRSILFMGLIGVILGSVLNIFWASSTLYWFVTFAGVLVFCGLTAYDMQKLKQIGSSGMDEETAQKVSIVGALSLYLDFINLFLFMLRIFGSAR
jgi:uncharacterized protein